MTNTAKHNGHAERVLPITPELRPILLQLFDEAADGAEHVIERHRVRSCNLRTTFSKIIRRAGLVPWPRLFHNMRGSQATDWCERFPAHVVAAWCGHSPMIAAKHYLTTRDAHFEAASSDEAGKTVEFGPSKAHRKAQQKAQQTTHGEGEQGLTSSGHDSADAVENTGFMHNCPSQANDVKGVEWAIQGSNL